MITENTKTKIYQTVFCVVIAFFLSRNCVADYDYCDPDPLYGGCPQTCTYEDLSLTKLALRTFGLYVFGNIFLYIKDYREGKVELKQ